MLINRLSFHSVSLAIVGVVGLAGAQPAAASIIYDFKLAADGAVGAIEAKLTFPSFVGAGGGLAVYNLAATPVTLFTSVTPVNASGSVEGFEVDTASTIVGLDLLNSSSGTVLFTTNYPADFFSFTRTANQTGTFTGTGNVVSSLNLSTSSPSATLTVTDTSVPEPASLSLLGVGAAALLRRRRRLA